MDVKNMIDGEFRFTMEHNLYLICDMADMSINNNLSALIGLNDCEVS